MSRLLAVASVCLFAAAPFAFAQQAPLRVVVIQGEDAVNVIQQKTATRPVVEVRDRNNLPVPGVLVTFSIEGGTAASFGGASTLTVATNAAGQAAVTSLTPATAGAFQIQVSAAFQGQLATATIAQTNVMTAAQAAAASAATGGASGSSAGGGAGGAGGGGLSTTTLAITGGVVAGGAVAALAVVRNGDDADEIFTGSFSAQVQTVSTSRNTGGSTCVFTRAISATVHFEIAGSRGDNVEGRMNIKGTETNVSNTCGLPAGGGMPVNWSVPVNGPNPSIRGSETSSFSNPLPTGSIQGTHTTSFEGARTADDTITGTLRMDVRSTSVIESGEMFDHITAGSFPLTLTKTKS